MSIQAITWVLEQSRSRLAARHVLLSIANHADRLGENSWPSVPTIALESNLSVREVQRGIKQLVEIGELSLERVAGRPNGYSIPNIRGDKLAPRASAITGDKMSPPDSVEKPVQIYSQHVGFVTGGVTSTPPGGDKSAAPIRKNRPETVTEPSERASDRSTCSNPLTIPAEEIAAVLLLFGEYVAGVDAQAAERLIERCRGPGMVPVELICRELEGALSRMPRHVENPVGWVLKVMSGRFTERLNEARSLVPAE